MHQKKKIVYVAAAALVNADGHVLLAQRPAGRKMAGLWEFPGGKVEEGETPEAALARELKEELDIDVAMSDLAALTFVSHDYGDFHLFMPLFSCRAWHGAIVAKEMQAVKWVAAEDLQSYPMPAADIPLLPVRDWMKKDVRKGD